MRRLRPGRVAAIALCLAAAGGLCGQDEAGGAVAAADLAAYETWLAAWSEGRILLVKQGRLDRRAERRFRTLFAKIAAGRNLTAARRLWQAAVLELPKDLDPHLRLAASEGRVRGLAKRLIAGIPDAAVDPWLVEIALRKGGPAGNRGRLVAIDVLGLRERPEAGKLLLGKLATFPMPERIRAVLALERTGSVEMLPVLLAMLKSREPNLRIALVQTICGILAPYSDQTRAVNVAGNTSGDRWTASVVEALRKLVDRDKIWQVRVAVCDGLVRLRHKLVIPVLIRGLERELRLGRWSNQMVAIAFHEALERITGQSVPENAPHLWKDFWRKEGPTFRFATRAQPRTGRVPSGVHYAKYFDLDIKTKRLLFVIDFSGSMAEKVDLEGRYAGVGSRQVKYQLVKKELEKVIRALPRDAICNIVFFNDRVSVWRRGGNGRPSLVKMTDDNKSDLLQFVWETSPGGSTNLFGALETALAMGERGVYDRYYSAAYDSVFVLSDGEPSSGATTDTDEILERVRTANKLRRLKIHTIVFGNSTNNLRFMRALAEQNGGRFMHVR